MVLFPACPLRLVVRTIASQAINVGSIPAGDGKFIVSPDSKLIGKKGYTQELIHQAPMPKKLLTQ